MPDEAVELSAVPGAPYFFKGHKGPQGSWAFRPGYYRCVGVARSYRTFQELVVYRSLNRWDTGLHLVGLSDWARDFYRMYEEDLPCNKNPESPSREGSEQPSSTTSRS